MVEKQVSTMTEIPEISEHNLETTEYDVKECTEENIDETEIFNSEDQNSKKYPKTISPLSVSKNKITVPKPFMSATANRSNSSGVNSHKSVKNSQMNSPTLSRKLFLGDDKKFQDNDDDDCWSLTSSAAGSLKSNKFKPTVASAPVFKCTERAEKRKEFYKKLEEKHEALEEERKQFEARIKEEQETVLKQLRKNMTYKANPVPEFYRQGPPPKPQLNKLPVTRPKSPKFNTSRRRFNTTATSQVEENEKISAKSVSHNNTGTYKQETKLSHVNRKTQSNGRSRVSASPSLTSRSEADNSPPPKMEEHGGSDVTVEF